MIPRIVERFPKYRNRILHALPRDGLMAELCEDYDKVVVALEVEKPQGEKSHTSHQELVRLKRELEYELLERLATSDGTEDDE